MADGNGFARRDRLSLEDFSTLRSVDGRTQWQFFVPVQTSHLGLEITPLEGKGIGILASRGFQRGERVLAESPLVAWSSAAGSSSAHDWTDLDALVGALAASDQSDFFGLCDKHSGCGRGKTAHGIWNSNSFPTEDVMGGGQAVSTDGIVRSAVFRICSRLNHSCRPNCFAAWSATRGQLTVHALCDISPGEEVTIAYVGGAEAGVRAMRQRLLSTKYGFDCACEACALSGDALKESERRQARIHEIHGEIACQPAALPALVSEHLVLMYEEGLPIIWGRAGLILAIVELKNGGDLTRAGQLAAVGAECAKIALGADSSAFMRLDSLRRAFLGDDDEEAVAMDGAPGSASSDAHPAGDGKGSGQGAATTAGGGQHASSAATVAGDTQVDEPEDEAPATRTYEVGEGHETFERAPSNGWDEATKGPRVLRFSLLSHRRRWAQKIWPAAQVLSRRLDAQPELVRGKSVLEIGAGASLPSVVAGLLGAASVVVSDYPDAKMLDNMRANLASLLSAQQNRRATVVGYDWNTPPQPLLDALARLRASASPPAAAAPAEDGFDLILLADLLYECEHEPILAAVRACLAAAHTGARALLTFQVHDRCQLPRQVAFFELAPQYGFVVRKLDVVTVGRQFDDDEEEEEEEEDEAGDVTAQVQLWELTRT